MDSSGPRRLMRRRARTFSLACRFLPPPTVRDVQVLYAYFRTLDDLADESVTIDVQQEIDAIEHALAVGGGDHSLIVDVRSVAKRYGIEIQLLHEIIEGVRLDLRHTRFDDYDALYSYADLVAGSVGATLCHVLGGASPPSLAAARKLGVAMQLTNILRDIGEDLDRGRLYLPVNDLTKFDLEIEDIRRHTLDERFAALMRFEIARARGLYDAGMSGLKYLDAANRFAVSAAGTLYREILTKIEDENFDVFSHRVGLTRHEKLVRLPHAWLLARRAKSHPRQATNELPDEHVSLMCPTGRR